MDTSNMFGRKESLVLNSRTFKVFAGVKHEKAMTVRGAVNKTAILLGIVTVSAAGAWLSTSRAGGFNEFPLWLVLAMPVALIVGVVTPVIKTAARFTAPLYAFLEGIVLGGISAVCEAEYPGIVVQAVFLTFGTLLGLLVIYCASGYQVTARFRTGVMSATLGILLVYLGNLVLHIIGIGSFPFLHQSGLIGIGFSLFVVCIAALNLVLDFNLIENGAQEGAPVYMEWYAAYGLMVTLVWLYLQILDFLMRLVASSDDDH